MIIKPYSIPGIYEITLSPYTDHRGDFTRIYDQRIYKNLGLDRNWVQENHSFSLQKGTIRGLHFQFPPYTETKLIRVTKGAIFDVFVDLRRDSPTFGEWGSIELTEDNYKMIYITRGFAHGFCSLSDECEVVYKVDNYYSPTFEGGIIWRDETLRIDWPVSKPIISDKDNKLQTLKEFKRIYKGIDH
jgi:dTDP-4-dehydrorhamnose 3,5-epimerase